MDGEFGDLAGPSAHEASSLVGYTRNDEGIGRNMIEEMDFHVSTNMATSPSAAFLDLNGFDFEGNYDWVTTINLPWFELQQKLELQGW
jgi:hypothetical protein